MKAPSECPVCGEPVPPGAAACPHCGADERTGWNEEQTRYDGIDLPEEAFGESPARRPRRTGLPRWLVLTLAVLALAAFVWVFVR